MNNAATTQVPFFRRGDRVIYTDGQGVERAERVVCVDIVKPYSGVGPSTRWYVLTSGGAVTGASLRGSAIVRTYFGRRALVAKTPYDSNRYGLRRVVYLWVDDADERNGGHAAGTLVTQVIRGARRTNDFEIVSETIETTPASTELVR